MIVRMYTTDNNQLNSYVEMPEEDYEFLRTIEHKYGDLSCEYRMERAQETPETIERYKLLMEKYVQGDDHLVSGPPGLCTYS